MNWLFRTVSSGSNLENVRKVERTGTTKSFEPLTHIERLRGYHDLAKEALEKAYEADLAGDKLSAGKRYKVGLSAIEEGLKQDAAETGLGPQFDNVAKWKHELLEWQELTEIRLKALDGVHVSSSSQRRILKSARQGRPGAVQQASQGLLRNMQQGGSSSKTSRAGETNMRELILAEVLDSRPSVRWEDIAGLGNAKQALQEMVILPALRADLFQGLRSPARGLLLYGPPGNGKTLLAKALAREANATFFNISASTLTSKWHGEAEKLVRTLFEVAAELQPSIIFIDEIDSILSERSSGEHEASRRLKTQFLVEFDGVAQASNQVVVIGATNRPQELDDAVRRRLVKRIYIPMPGAGGREALLKHTLEDQPAQISPADLRQLVQATVGYSGSDLSALCREAAMQPIRQLGPRVSTVPVNKIRPVNIQDFESALTAIRPSVSQEQMRAYEEWTKSFGTHA